MKCFLWTKRITKLFTTLSCIVSSVFNSFTASWKALCSNTHTQLLLQMTKIFFFSNCHHFYWFSSLVPGTQNFVWGDEISFGERCGKIVTTFFLTLYHKRYFISVWTLNLFLKSMTKLIEYGGSQEIWSKAYVSIE